MMKIVKKWIVLDEAGEPAMSTSDHCLLFKNVDQALRQARFGEKVCEVVLVIESPETGCSDIPDEAA